MVNGRTILVGLAVPAAAVLAASTAHATPDWPPVLTTPITHIQEYAQSSGVAGPFWAIAQCPAGTVLVGGGFTTSDPVNAPVRASEPNGNSWKAIAEAQSVTVHSVSAWALCASD